MNSNKISWILTELWSEKFEWFGPSPIEPFNLGPGRGAWGPRRRAERVGELRLGPELEGSIGEGSNHSNFSDQSSVKILSE